MIDILLKAVLDNKKKHLLLGTLATYHLKVFEKSRYWNTAKEFIVIPHREDQETIYKLIYQIKLKKLDESIYAFLKQISLKYEVKHLLAGCTEFHMLSSKALLRKYKVELIDPLNILAWEIAHMNVNPLHIYTRDGKDKNQESFLGGG